MSLVGTHRLYCLLLIGLLNFGHEPLAHLLLICRRTMDSERLKSETMAVELSAVIHHTWHGHTTHPRLHASMTLVTLRHMASGERH